jgi:hypothetical protein
MNIIIAVIGLGGIILGRYLIYTGTGMGIKNHLFILSSKLIISSFIIGLFLTYSEKHIWMFLILSGMINIIIFHFIEAFITQRELLHKRSMHV